MVSLADPRVSNPVLSSLKIQSTDKIIVIRENSHSDSNFLITHLLKQILYEKNQACFLTIHNPFDHYQNVGKKLGYDLSQAVASGEVRIIDPLEELVDRIGKGDENESSDREELLKCLFLTLRQQIELLLSTKTQPTYLIIDDLSHFTDLGIETSQIITFVNYCINLTNDDNISVILNAHVSSKRDEIVSRTLQYLSDVFIEVSALKTGRSSDVTGLMSVQRGENVSQYHYRAYDRGVKTFYPGESIYHLYK